MDLDDFQRRSTSNGLKVDTLLDQIEKESPDLHDVVLQALNGDPAQYPSKTIAEVLTRNGWKVSNHAIGNWRRANQHG